MWAGAFDSSVGTDDAVRGDEKIERRFTHCSGNPAMREWRADGARDVAVRDQFARFEL